MKKIKLLIAAAMLLFSVSVFAQTGRTYWQPVNGVRNPSSRIAENKRGLHTLKLYELDVNVIKKALASTPKRSAVNSGSGTVIGFPNPDGSFSTYRVTENSTMDPALQAKYPDIRSYVGKGIEDPTAIIYFSVSPLGVQTMLLRSNDPVVLIEPYTKDLSTYAVYKKGDRTSFSRLECHTIDKGINPNGLRAMAGGPNADDGILRTFRIVLSATGEYTAYFGGTKALALAAINNSLTRVNGIFESDFAVHFNLVANNDAVIYTDAATDPYSDEITNQQVQTTLTDVIGDANYDIGEAFGTQNQGGNAACVGCVCVNPAQANAPDQAKGSGYTTLPDPTGDIFDIDFLSHEIGHTLGGSHTFTYQPGLEGTIAQVEPGSGTTILSYAGYTGATDVLPHPYSYFHAISIQQIMNNIKLKTCPVNIATGNAVPTANAGPDYTIPNGTPFTLTGVGTDANDAGLLYNWEQMDVDVIDNTPYPNVTDVSGPEFRNFNISSSNTRTFPELLTVLGGATSSTWEAVPNVARTLNFRFTVRDNHAGGPANNSDDVVVTTATSGPFVVTVPNTAVSWTGNTAQNVTWDVAGSNAAPVNCANVKISLSTDGGLTFPTVLLASTPNDGTQSITVPNVTTTTARIKVEAVGNIFFDISNVNFSITAAAATFNIVATSGANGTVTPAGTTSVTSGANQTYTITANSCYAIANVVVDGVSQGAIGTYTFTGVTAPHTISATFTQLTYSITATSGSNGTVTPAGASSVNCGANQIYSIAANPGFTIANVLVDGISVGSVGTYTFTNVTAAHTISASFAAVVVNYTITASAGANGSISPSGAVSVASGANQTFTITANPGFTIANVLVDGISVGAVGTYTFTNVVATHTISASFAAVVVNYTITASAGANGSISPSGAVSVASGTNRTFTITANPGFTIANVLVDGISVGAVGTYTFTNVVATHTISASFAAVVVNYTITASAGANGSISPSGAVSVASGANQTFTITANPGFTIANVLVDGISVGAVGTYTFTNVVATHTISASFAAVVVNYTITASAGANGSISPSGAVSVASGTNRTFTITANPGFTIANVLVDGISVGAVGTYTFTNVVATHTISASFAAVVVNYTITASAGANGSISPSGAVSVASGTNRTFTITANSGYAVQAVLVDGVSQGAITTYTFINVTAAHTISASFVVTGNQQLVSNAGANTSFALPTSSVSLNGAASTGNIVQYYWYQAQGPVQSVIGNAFSSITTATGLTTAGTYVFGLQVKDNVGGIAYSYKTVTVTPAGPGSVPACVTNTSPANGSTIATQTTATLTWPSAATATSYDVYLAAGTGIPATLVANTASLTYSATGLTAGTTYSWYIAPRNASGPATACGTTNKTTFITATAGNQQLVSNAGANTSFALPTSSVSLNGAASTGNIVQYYWYQAQGPVQSVIGNAFSSVTTATGLTTAGTYVFGLQVKDNVGGIAYSYKTVSVTPAGPGSVPACVTNTSPANGSTIATQTTATLTWPSSATATSYDVYLAAGTGIPATLVANTASLTYSATGLTAGTTYSWYIAPRNASGPATACGTTNKTTFITATAGNQPPVSNAGSNATITLPTSSISLNGSASFDPDGSIVQYYWHQTQGPVQAVIGNNFLSVTNATGLTTAGTYVFGLQVKDNLGVLRYSYKTVIVKAAGSSLADAAAHTSASLKGDNSSLPSVTAVINPNPVATGQQAKLQINSSKAGTVMVSIVNSNGAITGSKRVNLVAGINTTTVNTAGLAQGFHIISISGSAKPLNLKLVIQ